MGGKDGEGSLDSTIFFFSNRDQFYEYSRENMMLIFEKHYPLECLCLC